MAFPVIKKLDLGFLSSEWSGAYLGFRGLSFAETRDFVNISSELDTKNPESSKNLDVVINLLKEHFIDGKAFNGSELVTITNDNLVELPLDAITKAVELLAGAPNPNS